MNIRKLIAVTGVVAASLVAQGCSTTVRETHTYIAKNPDKGDLTLFRVTISGNTQMSEAKYDAGWRAAEAVDEVFSNAHASFADPNKDNYDTIRSAQKEMVKDLSAKLKEVGSSTDESSAKKYKEYEDQLVRALSLERRLHAAETNSSPDAPAEKFIIVLASDPNQVFAEIEQVVARQENEGALVKTFSSFFANAHREDYQSAALWNQVEQNSGLGEAVTKYRELRAEEDKLDEVLRDKHKLTQVHFTNYSTTAATAKKELETSNGTVKGLITKHDEAMVKFAQYSTTASGKFKELADARKEWNDKKGICDNESTAAANTKAPQEYMDAKKKLVADQAKAEENGEVLTQFKRLAEEIKKRAEGIADPDEKKKMIEEAAAKVLEAQNALDKAKDAIVSDEIDIRQKGMALEAIKYEKAQTELAKAKKDLEVAQAEVVRLEGERKTAEKARDDKKTAVETAAKEVTDANQALDKAKDKATLTEKKVKIHGDVFAMLQKIKDALTSYKNKTANFLKVTK